MKIKDNFVILVCWGLAALICGMFWGGIGRLIDNVLHLSIPITPIIFCLSILAVIFMAGLCNNT